MKESLNLEVADGKLSFFANYYFNADDINATSIYDAQARLDGLRIKPTKKYKDVLNLDSFYVQNATIKPMQKSVHIDKVGLTSLYVKSARDSKGNIDWLEYIKVNTQSKKSEVTAETKVEAQEPWSVVLDRLALEKIKVDFLDRGISPQVATKLHELNFYAQNITLAGVEPITYKMNLHLNKEFKCTSEGDIIHSKLEINSYVKCNDFSLIHYRPYIDKAARDALSVYNIKLIRAHSGFDAKVNLKEINKEMVVDVKEANFNLDKLALNKRSNGRRLVSFSKFDVKGISLNTKSKDVRITKVSLNALDIKASRLADGVINIDGLVVPKTSKKVKRSKHKKEKDYRVKLKHFSLNAARVRFNDEFLTPSVKSKLDRIYFNAYNIDSKRGSWLSYAFSSRVNSKGYIKSKGSLRHTPIKQKGTFELKKISLVELNPYIKEKAYVKLSDGFLSIKSKTEYAPSSKKPDLRVYGSFQLNEIFVNDTRDNAAILSFNEMGLKSFTLEALPNRLHINEANIDGFYIDTQISKNKELNLALLAKVDENSSSQVIENEKEQAKETFPYRVDKLSVNMGSAKFADLSLPIDFKTHIHDLNGVIYSLTNKVDETTYINIVGEVDKYGSTRLNGSVDSAKPTEFTDLSFSFKNLDLNSLSGYSASFAGHEIDSGKLYLDLDYDILNSEMKGSNSVIMKKVVLGREVDDENITVLPLGFVLGLLEDSDGVIDLDMAVEGNVDAPDFKYGPLVLKTITDLIANAVTSPFKFLGSVMGFDGEKLAYLDFEAGKSVITPPEREKLDQIAKIMLKKPKISLNIVASYDAQVDKKALQLEKLINLVMKKSGLKNREEHESVMSVDLLEEIYEDIKDDDALDLLQKRLHKEYDDKTFERVYQSALIKLCRDIQPLEKKELTALADARNEAIILYLNLEKFIFKNRIIKADFVMSESIDGKLIRSKMQIEVK